MTWRGTFHMAVGFVFLAMLLTVKPAWADKELDEQIKALEKEVAKIEPLKDIPPSQTNEPFEQEADRPIGQHGSAGRPPLMKK